MARVWFDPELIEPGVYPLVVDITYADVKGKSRTCITRGHAHRRVVLPTTTSTDI